MLAFERLDLKTFPWTETHALFGDQTIFQSPDWLSFLASTQKGEPVLASIRRGSNIVGYFTGMIVSRFGIRILGSPFPGWSTSYMGLNLLPGVSMSKVLEALKRFAFGKLGCWHLECLDRKFRPEEVAEAGFKWTPLNGFEVSLMPKEDEIFSCFQPSCRQAIRKAIRLGVRVQETQDAAFAEDYCAQLQDVFAKQGLVPTYGVERVHELIRYIQPTGKLLLLRARDSDDHCIATGIFVQISRKTMYFWGGASWRAYQHLRPNDLLMWTAMRLGKARGIETLDMGGAGDYKKKFGGSPISVPWVRASSQPFIPLLRDTAKRLFHIKQQLQGRIGRNAQISGLSPHAGIDG